MPEDLKPPIFVISNNRSGSTVVQRSMALSSEVVGWYEPRSLWMYADPGRPHDEFDERDATEKVRKYIRRRFLSYQRKHGRRIVEKTPANILKISYVSKIFPEASYIYVVRSPFSYINSSELKWQRLITPKGMVRRLRDTPLTQVHYYGAKLLRNYFDKYLLKKKYLHIWGVRYKGIQEDLKQLDLLTVIARQWAVCSKKAEEDLAKLDQDRVLRFKYEDYVSDPVAHLERICRHTGIEMTDDMTTRVIGYVDPGRQEKWRRLAPGALRKILPELKAEMDRHGYVVPEALLEAVDEARSA